MAIDDTSVATSGSWLGDLQVDNQGLAVVVTADVASGDLSTPFSLTVTATGADIYETRLLHNQRVVAATNHQSDMFEILGAVFGGGPVELVAEADFVTGEHALSPPLLLEIAFQNPPPDATEGDQTGPTAYGYHRQMAITQALLLELPAADSESPALTWSVTQPPAQAQVDILPGGILWLDPRSAEPGTDDLIGFYRYQLRRHVQHCDDYAALSHRGGGAGLLSAR